jgi:pimeloyl-ACP methyl ester carboxylesterase
MWPFALFVLTWMYLVALSYVILYYESANSPHLEVLRSRGPVFLLLVRGFFSTLLSHVLLAVAALTGLYPRFWRLPPGPAGRPPVIFVHGLYHNRTAWFFYFRWFRRWGWSHLKAITLRGIFRPIDEQVKTLAEAVDEVVGATGSVRVDLVGHSMGGLVIRAFLAAHRDQGVVRTAVTLGTPHAGSKLAVFAVGGARKDLLPGSPFLTALNASGVQVPRDGHLYSIYSMLDTMVLPNDSAIPCGEGVTSLGIGPVNHVGLLFSRRTAELVRGCLE